MGQEVSFSVLIDKAESFLTELDCIRVPWHSMRASSTNNNMLPDVIRTCAQPS